MNKGDEKEVKTAEDGVQEKAAALVTPSKPSKARRDGEGAENREPAITGDSFLHFPRHPELTNREIVINHCDFVNWARKHDENAQGNLKLFLEWLDTDDEAKAVELEGRGNEKFTYGQHKAKKFCEVASDDPEYHERYLRALRDKRKSPDAVLARYIEYFKDWNLAQRGNEEFTYGQHYGKKFCEIAVEDPFYHTRYLRALRSKDEEPDDVLTRYIAYFNDWKHAQKESKKRTASPSKAQTPDAKKQRKSL